MKNNIALAFSGGVDSTISAVKLSQEGYNVHAVHFNFWKWKDERNRIEEIDKSIADLRKVINLSFSIIDAADKMRKIVISDFIKQLELGKTPNPCVRCNPLVKFRLLLDFAEENSIDKIATGHYAQIRKNNAGKCVLYMAKDKTKDQSYMLSNLTQAILSKTIFPLGDTTKKEVMRFAQDMGLVVSKQPESQDLCFLNQNSYQDFIKHFSPDILVTGDIVDASGKLLGKHDGLALYTIGQRKGIRVASSEPYYVLEKDIPNNRLIVGYLSELGKDRMKVKQVNWITGDEIEKCECDVKIRYQSKLYRGTLIKDTEERSYTVSFNEKIRDITPGQYAVFYKDEEVLGGGLISEAWLNA